MCVGNMMAEGGSSTASATTENLMIVIDDYENWEVESMGVLKKRQVQHHCKLFPEALQDFQHRIVSGHIKDVMC